MTCAAGELGDMVHTSTERDTRPPNKGLHLPKRARRMPLKARVVNARFAGEPRRCLDVSEGHGA
jgi:hypothetical protein